MNLYRGCCHGCIYCDSRSSCYGIEDFDTVRAKENALFLLRNELSRKVKKGVVGMGAMSDPYNPFEREALLTRHALELLSAYAFGAALATKSDLVTRDIDVLQEISSHSPVLVKITITCADDALAKKIEPHAQSSSRRFETLSRLSEAGIFCGVLLMPVLPFLTDSEENLLAILRQASACGARFVYPALGVTLRDNQRDWYYARLDERFPGLSGKYRRQFGSAYRCSSPKARPLWNALKAEGDRLGLLLSMREIVRASRMGYESGQLRLF